MYAWVKKNPNKKRYEGETQEDAHASEPDLGKVEFWESDELRGNVARDTRAHTVATVV